MSAFQAKNLGPISAILVGTLALFEAFDPAARAGTITWTGAGGNSLWFNPKNWSGQAVPGVADDVVINAPGAGAIALQAGTAPVRSLQCENDLSLSGNLTLSGGSSWVHGGLLLQGGRLTVTGSGSVCQITGQAVCQGGEWDVLKGGQLSWPNLQSMTNSSSSSLSWVVQDAGSVLSFPALANVILKNGFLNIRCSNGGLTQAPGLGSVNGPVNWYVEGENSRIDLPSLAGVLGSIKQDRDYLEVRSGGAVLIPLITSLENTRLILAATQMTTDQITALRQGELRVEGANLTLPNLTDMDGSDLTVVNGGQLTLPGVTQLARITSGNVHLSASGKGSVLRLPNLATASVVEGYHLGLQALDGGQILLPALASLRGAFDADAEGAGAGSVIDLSGWVGTLSGTTSTATYLEVHSGASLLIPNVTALARIGLTVQGTGQIPTAQLVSLTHSQVTIDGAQLSFGSLSDTTGTTFAYLNKGSASFPTPVDLTVTRILPPATAVANQPVPIIWELTNIGITLNGGSWSDSLFVCSDPTGGGSRLIVEAPNRGDLAHGASRLVTNVVVFPAELRGTWYLAVAANQSRTVFEGTNTLNNTNISTSPIQIQAPDLLVDSVTVQTASATLGQSVDLKWTVRNAGTAPAAAPWTDRVWLAPDPASVLGCGQSRQRVHFERSGAWSQLLPGADCSPAAGREHRARPSMGPGPDRQ